MELIISSPLEQRTLHVAWFEIDTPAGNFIIQAGHIPTLLTLLPNHTLTIRLKSGKQETIAASSGIVHVTRQRSTIILGD